MDKFYGNLSIQEYRKTLADDRIYFVVNKPNTKIMPELYEDNNDEPIIYNDILNKKPKTLLTFIRTVYGSLEYLIEAIDDIELIYGKERIIKLHEPENVHVNEWILVE